MRIFVFSDTHGKAGIIYDALARHGEPHAILHLGDGWRDLYPFMEEGVIKDIICVSGNCDFASPHPATRLVTFSGKRIFMAHGHTFGVKRGLSAFAAAVRDEGADIGLFGHTHMPFDGFYEGARLLNPGAGGYAIIEIDDEENLKTRLFKRD